MSYTENGGGTQMTMPVGQCAKYWDGADRSF